MRIGYRSWFESLTMSGGGVVAMPNIAAKRDAPDSKQGN
jgi:hypothetical protein